jgi:hypothetical protein
MWHVHSLLSSGHETRNYAVVLNYATVITRQQQERRQHWNGVFYAVA